MSKAAQNIIKEKLNAFIKKYYWYQVWRGLLSAFAVSCAMYLSFASLAYFYFLSSDTRFIFTLALFITFGVLLAKEVLWPALKLLKLGKRLSDERAANIIGKHFKTEIDDKLLNAIHLLNSGQENELVLASIKQKTGQLKTFDFGLAIPFGRIKRAIKIAVVPALILLFILGIKPSVITTGTTRMVSYNKEFLPENPYQWELMNKTLKGIRNEAFEIKIKCFGPEVPTEVLISLNGDFQRLTQNPQGEFSFRINHLTQDMDFRIKTGIYESGLYRIEVADRPKLSELQVTVKKPGYLGGKTTTISNEGNISVAEGSTIAWSFTTSNCDSFLLVYGEKDSVFCSDNTLLLNKTATKSTVYSLRLFHHAFAKNTQYSYDLNVIQDEYPTINTEVTTDTLHAHLANINGFVSDDHGISKLKFHYSTGDSSHVSALPIETNLMQQSFIYRINFEEIPINDGQKISYYFEVVDNDGTNGGKSSFSEKLHYSKASKSQKDSLINQDNQQLKSLLASAQKEAQTLQKEYQAIKKLLLEKKSLSWQEKQKISDLLSHQKAFEENIKNIQNTNEKNSAQKKGLNKKDLALLEKQKQINKLFDELMDEETKKLFDELEKLMEEMNDDKRERQLEKMNLSNENMEKSLDRALALFKQMEFEQKLKKVMSLLQEVQKKQEALTKETEKSSKKVLETLKKKQDDIAREFDALKNKLSDLKKKHENLDQQNVKMPSTLPQEKEASSAMKESSSKLSKAQKKSAKKNQEKASKAMDEISKQLAKMQEQMQQDNQEEDLFAMRQLLENLVFLSVEQENLLTETKKINRYGSEYSSFAQKQKKLQDDAKMIEDSLFALSKRQPSLASYINKEIHEITFHQDKSLKYLGEKQPGMAAVNQQFVMASANNLALILDESIQNMQNSMMKKKFGQGSCNKPGGSKPKPGSGMKGLQKMLKKQLAAMREALKKQGKSPGKSGKRGEKGDAKSFGKMAAEQNAISDKLKKLQKQLQNKGNNGLGNGKQLENKLSETEKELLNKQITPETIRRQQEILTRLLVSEKALKERDYEDKRTAKQGKHETNRNPTEFLEYKKAKKGEQEMLKIILPSLKIFYKKKVNEYFNAVEN